MRPARSSAGFLSSRGVKLLIGLPLFLAAFALALQFSSPRHGSGSRLTLSGLPEPETITLGNTQSLRSRSLITTQDSRKDQQKSGQIGSGRSPDLNWKPNTFLNETSIKIAFVSTTAEGYELTKQWIDYHRVIGVTNFYLFVDGVAARPEVSAQLRALPGVSVIPRDDDLKYKHDHSRIWNETWLSAFFHKPCNHELFVRQSLNMEEAIKLALKDSVDWILHIDTDELVYPGGAPDYSLQSLLSSQPPDMDMIVFPNYESMPESDHVVSPFQEVTLFKRNFHHVVSDAYFKQYRTVSKGNPNYFITYGNGKSAARVQQGLRPNGAHRWYSYEKTPRFGLTFREETSETAAVLHFTYNRFSDLKSRRDRCDCAPTEEDAERCFILPFDRLAFLAASHKSDEELHAWFVEHLIWDDPNIVNELVRNGLFIRAYEPQVIVRGSVQAREFEKKTLEPDLGSQEKSATS